MALTKFRLVGHEGLKGLYYNGKLIPFEKIDDKLAEQLLGKTHVLERLADPAPEATAPAELAPAPAVAELPAAEEAPAPTTSRRRING